MKRLFMVLALLFSAVLVSAQDLPTDRFEKVVNRMVKAINDANYLEIQKDFAQSMRDFLPLEKSKPLFQGLTAQYGKIQKLDKPRLNPAGEGHFCSKVRTWHTGYKSVAR